MRCSINQGAVDIWSHVFCNVTSGVCNALSCIEVTKYRTIYSIRNVTIRNYTILSPFDISESNRTKLVTRDPIEGHKSNQSWLPRPQYKEIKTRVKYVKYSHGTHFVCRVEE